ncbi:hypothetical protein LAC81_30140 [Ensifer adhaerens]|uniref:hypothetical protein n=1 Tax=Ensifer adhaerens TaxID=106592 RepID=UPI001CBFD6FB|nr:hypothetical protein [Ensifer adhaerens]MBZ7925000.1 hypothetical protein [Ensifer adhaerens]UAX95795.1 hypothetical protein LAC78_33690 [Ensifer adhaerens]UAY04864.1 hypothetical protein LAC80_26620 [Ensifer adhaerens]UAY10296.1 hypothetical protein LAC81_30140 [Ensifer adhaerens]
MNRPEKPTAFFAISFNIAAVTSFGGGAIFRFVDIDGRSTRLIVMRESLTHFAAEGRELLTNKFIGWEEKERTGSEREAYEEAVHLLRDHRPEMTSKDYENFSASEMKDAFKFDAEGDLCELSTHAKDQSYQHILMLPTTLRALVVKCDSVLGILRTRSS